MFMIARLTTALSKKEDKPLSEELTKQALPQLKKLFRMQWEPAQDAHVLLYPEGMVTLNESAAEILQLCDGEKDVSAIISALETKFPAAGSLEADILEFLEEAKTNGWIEYR